MRVKLFASYDQALEARRALACQACGDALGVRCTTPSSYFADVWDLWGDGRALVTPVQRLLCMFEAIGREGSFEASLGTAQLMASFVERYAGCPQLDGAVANAKESHLALSEPERAVLEVMRRYFAELDELALVEQGGALACVGACAPIDDVEIAVPLDLAPAQMRFLERSGKAFPHISEAEVCPLADDVSLSLLIPSGASSVISLVRDEIDSIAEEAWQRGGGGASVAVCAQHPREVFEALSPYLTSQGVDCVLRCTVEFSDTAFGRACMCVRMLLEGTSGWVNAATDYAFSPYSGMSYAEAQELNTQLRGDRLLSCDDACALLQRFSQTFGIMVRLVGHDDASALQELVEYASARGVLGPHQAPYERAALTSYALLLDELGKYPSSFASADDLSEVVSSRVELLAPAKQGLDGVDGRASSEGGPSDVTGMSSVEGRSSAKDSGHVGTPPCSRVTFLPIGSVSQLAAGSYDAVIISDVSDAAFGARLRRSSLDTLAEKLGIFEESPQLGIARAAFSAAQGAARRHFACVMPLRNEASEDAYVGFPFEEFMAAQAQCASTASAESLCMGTFEVPGALAPCVVSRGEDDLVTGMGRTFCAAERTQVFPVAQRGHLESLKLVEHMRTVQEGACRKPVLSPSALEAYAACPYKWFVERRIRLREIDEGFSPLEKGAFVHEVFAAYYDELARRGMSRIPVGAEGEEAAGSLFDQVFDAVVRRQASLAPGSGRLVAVSENEALQIEALRALLRKSLARLARLPQGYCVYAHERAISEEEGIDYAGARLSGRADRIDVNVDAGRFVVLDYKGSVLGHAAGMGEDANPDELSLPGKTQALVYAQALRHTLADLHCAGALYLSYRARSDAEFAAGSYDESAYDVSSFARGSSRVCMNFERFLDCVEHAMEPLVAALTAGNIERAPSGSAACTYCPVSTCDRRMR